MKRSSDLSALIDSHKPLVSTPRVGKGVQPRKALIHMLILGYKYRQSAEERQERQGAHQERKQLAAKDLSFFLPPQHLGAEKLDYNDGHGYGQQCAETFQHQRGKEGRSFYRFTRPWACVHIMGTVHSIGTVYECLHCAVQLHNPVTGDDNFHVIKY